MAKPRVFISSTYYDLKHLRFSLENFIESLGFEPVLSEKGDIAYAPDMPLDESCYREAKTADIFVLIVGGRYGAETSREKKKATKEFFERYNSITKSEYHSAISRDVPTYILVESNVYSEYRTFLKNKGNKSTNYAHVDSVNIFHLIEEILSQPKNNPVHAFDKYTEVEGWLKEQWAGLFKDLLTRMSNQQQLSSLSSKVSELGEINVTLQRYMERIIKKVSPKESEEIIETESKRLQSVFILQQLKNNEFIFHFTSRDIFTVGEIVDAVQKATSFKKLFEIMTSMRKVELLNNVSGELFEDLILHRRDVQGHINKIREIFELKPFLLTRN